MFFDKPKKYCPNFILFKKKLLKLFIIKFINPQRILNIFK